ncbi:MAG: hypothetical protein QM760_17785 [Nibricoccus sp.]
MKKVVVLLAVLLVVGWVVRERFSATKSPEAIPAPTKEAAAQKKISEKTVPAAPSAPMPAPDNVTTPQAPAVETRRQPEKPQAFTYPQMSLAEVVRPGNVFNDDLFGTFVVFPEGWSVKQAIRWGENNRENTVFFQPPEGSRAVPSMYYQKYPEGVPTGSPEAYLRDLALKKEASRRKDGFPEYQNDPGSYVYREIGGHPSLSYSATYISQNGEVHAEYFTRILGPGGYVMFFVKGPTTDIQAIIPAVHQMSGTVTPP